MNGTFGIHKSSGAEKNEFVGFRRWLFSLSQQELLDSMQFTFHNSPGTNECHEYDLLMEMVRLQLPLQTPVHPRALGYKPRSQFGPQLDYEHGKEKSRWTKPRLFQWSERQSFNPRIRRGRPQRRFDIIARNKIAPWGEVYSLGSTREQREEDRRILEGTFLKQATDTERCAYFVDTGLSPRSIIRMLQVTSRGFFLQHQLKSSIPFCACWLQPTERWFSLSSYLASRYQMALWKSFRGNSKNQVQPIKYDPYILEVAIPSAVKMGLRQSLNMDKQKLDYLRDSLLWNALSMQCVPYDGQDWVSVWKSWTEIPLLQSQKPIHQLQNIVRKNLEQTIVNEMGKVVLQDHNTVNPSPIRKQTRKIKQKNKKKKRQRGGKNDDTQERIESLGRNDIAAKEKSEAQEKVQAPSFKFLDNQTSPQSRNRNIIFALTILEKVVEDVFLKVGLEATPQFGEGDNEDKSSKKGAKLKIEQGYFRSQKSKSPKSAEIHHSDVTNSGYFQVESKEEVLPSQPDSSLEPMNTQIPIQWSLTPLGHDPVPTTIMASSVLPTNFYRPVGIEDFSFGRNSDDALDEWPFENPYQSRERSILTDFFQSQEVRSDEATSDDDEKLMAASTAASISSSTYKDSTIVADTDDIEKGNTDETAFTSEMVTIREDENSLARQSNSILADENYYETESRGSSERSNPQVPKKAIAFDAKIEREDRAPKEEEITTDSSPKSPSRLAADCRSPSPQAPVTPPPTLSPILVSLADLRDLRHLSLTPERRSAGKAKSSLRTFSDTPLPGSLPSSPVLSQKNRLTPSWSREDLRITSFRDDHRIKQKVNQPRLSRSTDLQQTYKSVAVKFLTKPIASSKSGNVDFRTHFLDPSNRRDQQRESCAQSETAMEGHHEDHHWHHDSRKHLQEEIDSKSVIKDETTTITSALSQREPEEIASIREERNSFRDMCLTLGAEVAKLKAMLAAQTATTAVAPLDHQDAFNQSMYRPGSFDPNGMPPFFHGMMHGQRLGAMSDAGFHRGGDHDSQVSEDEGFDTISKVRGDAVGRISAAATVAGSDASIELNPSVIHSGPPIGRVPRYDSSSAVHGLQSRLTEDVLRFLSATSTQLKKQGKKRRMAIERFSRLVNTLWPRAQVKCYGSHVAGLCLPSSDLDFVVCLPAVHKNAPALAPGVLEGRNAINESSQKLLARELKGESWIDPRSIKLIERTVVPVIKVSTKDTRARMLQLDISFDSPEHHGLEAVEMVSQILEELPLIRPLMLVLKQFLLDRGLLTAYTGGLSSYCLFMMVARYLQEQPSSCGDCGSLLMGFLDFYGNFFDPRATGISVRRRQYFVRSNYAVAGYQTEEQGLWSPSQQHVNLKSPSGGSRDFLRRNSLSDAGSVDGVRRPVRPRRLSSTHRYVSHNVQHPPDEMSNSFGHGRPFTFDPLFVEDPLSYGNNVGRNAFRIFQVQRAFSDAHRALVASLEWDITSSGELTEDVDYPLLKCLLQSEDVFYEL